MENIVLKIENLTKSYSRNYREDRWETNVILDGLDMEIEKGRVTGLIGGNGSGKTTLFNIISGLTDMNGGTIAYMNGEQQYIHRMAPEKREQVGIGRMFQEDHLFPSLSVLENLIIADNNLAASGIAGALWGRKQIKNWEVDSRREAENLLTRFFGTGDALWQKRDDPAGELSFGQRRIISLLRLFMKDYKLILLDEPISGVDPGKIDEIGKMIQQFVCEQGTSVFLIEHSTSFVKEICDTSHFIYNGKIRLSGNTLDVLNHDIVKENFLSI